MNSDNLDLVGNLCSIILRVRAALKLEINEETGLYCTSYSGEVANIDAQKKSRLAPTLEYDDSSGICVLQDDEVRKELEGLLQSEGKQHQLVEISLDGIIGKKVCLIVDMPTTYLCGIRKGDEYYHIGNDDDSVVTILKKCKKSKKLSSSAAYDDHDEMLWNWSANYNQYLTDFFGACIFNPSILSDRDILEISKKQLDEFIALVFELARHPGLYNNIIKSLKNPNGNLDIKQIINVGKEWNKGNVSETKVDSCKEYDLINSLGNLGDVLCANYVKSFKNHHQDVDRLFYYVICQYHMILDNMQYLGSDGQNENDQKALNNYVNLMSELFNIHKLKDSSDKLSEKLEEIKGISTTLLDYIKANKKDDKWCYPEVLLENYVKNNDQTTINNGIPCLIEVAVRYGITDQVVKLLKENRKLDISCSNKILEIIKEYKIDNINIIYKDILENIYIKYSLDEVVNFAKKYKIIPQMLEMLLGKQLFNETVNDIGAKNMIAFAKQYELILEMIEFLTKQLRGKFALPVGREHYVIGQHRKIEKLVNALKDEILKKTGTISQQEQVDSFENLLARAKEAIKFLDESWRKSLIDPIIEKAEVGIEEAKRELIPSGGPKPK